MRALRRLLFLTLFTCGQIALMGLARFLFTWNLDYADAESPQGEALLTVGIVGAAFVVARLLDGLADPIAGTVSDRWVRRGRQRRSLLWFSFLLLPLGLALVFFADHGMAPAARWVLLLSGMFVFFVGYTFYAIPYWSLIDDYSRGQARERIVLSNALGGGLLLAVAVVAVISPGLVDRLGFRTSALLFAAVAAVLLPLPYFAAPQDQPQRPPPPDEPQAAPPLVASLLEALRHRRFLAVVLLFAGSQMAFTAITSASPFIVSRLLGGTRADVAVIMAPFLATAIPFFLVAPWLARRVGWEKAVVLATVALAIVYGGTAFLGREVIGTPMQTAMVLFAFGGPMAALLLGLEGEAIASCARDREREVLSLYFGVFNLVVKSLNGVAMLLVSLLVQLGRVEGYEVAAVRYMGITAGLLLLLGLTAYGLLRPRGAAAVSPPR